MTGALVVDKPSGWTSHDVVNKVRRYAGTRRVGHLGTLDPLATGVLPLLLNRATRLAQFFSQNEKRYEATVRFGFATDSYDAGGEPITSPVEPAFSPQDLEAALGQFRGAIQQVPPPVSAKKVAGQPAYRLARRGVTVELPPVSVTVHQLIVTEFRGAEVSLRIHCSAGTYVRAIAHQLGLLLQCGAHLKDLRRTMSGPFHIGQAKSLDELAGLSAQARLAEALIPAVELLPEFPLEIVDSITEAQIRNGREFRVSPFRANTGARYVKAVSRDSHLIAIGEIRLPSVYHPVLVL